jgi:hypothetical protein
VIKNSLKMSNRRISNQMKKSISTNLSQGQNSGKFPMLFFTKRRKTQHFNLLDKGLGLAQDQMKRRKEASQELVCRTKVDVVPQVT